MDTLVEDYRKTTGRRLREDSGKEVDLQLKTLNTDVNDHEVTALWDFSHPAAIGPVLLAYPYLQTKFGKQRKAS